MTEHLHQDHVKDIESQSGITNFTFPRSNEALCLAFKERGGELVSEAGGMDQFLEYPLLLQRPELVPRTHVWQFIKTFNSGESNAL